MGNQLSNTITKTQSKLNPKNIKLRTMEAFMAYDLTQAFEQRINQIEIDQNLQPAHTNTVQAEETQEIAVVTKPSKKAALKKQTSFGRVLAATSKACNPILRSAGLMTM